MTLIPSLAMRPFIESPHEDDWEDTALVEEMTDPVWKRVDWIMRIHALDPESMTAHSTLYRQAMKSTSTLRKLEREMIALVVSQANDCHY